MSMAKQHSDSTNIRSKRPKGEGKRSYQRALRQAEKTGSTKYKGKILTLSELGGTPAITQSDRKNKSCRLPSYQENKAIAYLSWNAGSLTTAVWEELFALFETDAYAETKLVMIQETHWRGSWQFSKGQWHVISSGFH